MATSTHDSSKPVIKVDIVSDTVCPWCFVGKHNLEQAMSATKDKYNFEVEWHPFQLNPDAPKEGVVKRDYYASKFGAARTQAMEAQMAQRFKEMGYSYTLEGLTGSTLDSHRLMELAKQQGKENEMMQELFENYFTQGKHIGDVDVLVKAADKVGVTGAREFLADPNAGREEVLKQLRNYARGVSGVPHFKVNNRYELSGAQPPESFVEVFEAVGGSRSARSIPVS